MRAIWITMALCLPECGLAQGIAGGGGSTFSSRGAFSSTSGSGSIPGRPAGIGSLQVNLRMDPPSAGLLRTFLSSYHGRSSPGESFFSRELIDPANHVYFGYELILEEQQPGTYLATFGKLGLTAFEAAASSGSKWRELSEQPLPALPDPRVVHDGDRISIELMTTPSGEKLIDDIEIRPFTPLARLPLPVNIGATGGNRPVPTVSGTARDFSATDAELQLTQPRVTFNEASQDTTTRGAPLARGALVWFYLPGHGRYILSLVARPELDFEPAGEVRGGAVSFTLDKDSIKLECMNPVAAGDSPYNLYVLHDPEYEPTAQAQKGKFALGTVGAAELAALKRK